MHPVHRLALVMAVAMTSFPALAAGTLDHIKSSGEIRLGIRTDAAPMSYTGTDGLAAGYTVDVCKSVTQELAKFLGVTEIKPTYVQVTAQDRFDAVANGKVDLLCEASTITLSRRAQVDFSIPTFVDGAAVLLRKGESPELSALAGKKIGVIAGTTTETALRNTLAATKTNATVEALEGHQAGIAALEAGKIDAYFGDQAILLNLLLKQGKESNLSISDNTLTVEKQGLALPRGDDDFRLAVDTALSGLYHSGRMAEIFKYNMPGARPSPALSALFALAPDLP